MGSQAMLARAVPQLLSPRGDVDPGHPCVQVAINGHKIDDAHVADEAGGIGAVGYALPAQKHPTFFKACRIDPVGDAWIDARHHIADHAIGRWRETERIEGGTGNNPPVDASGTLPNGKAFAGPTEFKKLLAKNEDELANAFLEQLATYALRRVMTVDDAAYLQAIAESTKAEEYRLQSLIRRLVMSDLFQRR